MRLKKQIPSSVKSSSKRIPKKPPKPVEPQNHQKINEMNRHIAIDLMGVSIKQGDQERPGP